MQTVRCPHCSTGLTNDGSLAGQLATCAACGQVFQMPALPPEAVQPEPPDVEDPGEEEFDISGPRRRKAGKNRGFLLFMVVALVVLPLITLVVGVFVILSGNVGKKKAPRGK